MGRATMLLLCAVVLCMISTTIATNELLGPSCLDVFLDLGKYNETLLAIMFDSTGKSVNDLGKWEECRDLGKNVAQYCTLSFSMDISVSQSYLGVCAPAACNTSELEILANMLLNSTAVKYGFEDFYQKVLDFEHGKSSFHCPADTPSIRTSAGGIVMIIISFFLAVLVIIGTLLDGIDNKWWPEPVADIHAVSTIGGIQDSGEVKPLMHSHRGTPRKSKLFEFFLAFSVVRNFKSLIGPSPPALAFLNGMRAISITWVILGHSLDYMNYAGVLNFAHVVNKDIQHASAQVFPAAEFSVDSFFWLSGFLVTYLTVQELQKKNRLNWFLYYFHRVWRLSPAYFYALFFYMCVSVYMSDGPMWPRYMETVQETCGKYWWTNVLYINNFIPSVWKDQCFLWGWYLAVDMQLYIVAPIVFVLYHKSKMVAWVLVVLMIIGTTVINGVFAHQHHFVWNSFDPSQYMAMIYGKPYTRAAPWLLGILCGFLYLEKRQLNKVVVYIGWVISAIVMLLCVYGPTRQFRNGPTEFLPINAWTAPDNLMYFTFAKLGWSLALSFLMYSMAMGWGGFVRRFLGAQFWNPLARLTYSTYLFHPIIMFVVYYSHMQFFSYDQFYIAVIFVGIMFLSFSTAAIMFLVLERPMTNMEKLFLPHKK